MSDKACPYCGADAVEVTLSEDSVRYFLCVGPEQHRFTWEHEEIDADALSPRIILAKQ